MSVLRQAAAAEGGGRELLCGTCLTSWPFRRVLCPRCGEQDERRLGYFHSPAYDHLRVDACDTCKHYVKSIDLTRLGLDRFVPHRRFGRHQLGCVRHVHVDERRFEIAA